MRALIIVGSLIMVLIGTAAVAAAAEPTPAEAADLDDDGRWGPVETWPLVAIHAVLTADGEVLTYGTDTNGGLTGAYIYDTWTPGPSAATGHQTRANEIGSDLFCNLQLNQAETGDVLLFGGDQWTGGSGGTNADINAYDPTDNTLATLPGMNRQRWYGSGTTLADGSFYIQGGTGGFDRPELWTAERGAELLPFYTFDIDIWYPRNFLLPDGRIFGFDIAGRMYLIPADLSRLDVVGFLEMPTNARGSTGVMFEPGKILEFGGDTTTAYVIDATGPAPVVTTTGSLAHERAWVDGVLLPDGRVMAIGGADKDSQQVPDDPIETYGVHLSAEIWDPDTGVWTEVAANAEERLYHSTALLLPDGRVLSAGGGAPGPVTNTTAELYQPDYLLTAEGQPTDRPVITSISATDAVAGDTLALTVDDVDDVDRVTLVKSGAATHSVDMDQRFIEADFSVADDVVTVALPSNPAIVPPGLYLLTVLDHNGVPSHSELVTITSSAPPPPPPPPAPLRATLGDEVLDPAGDGVEGVTVDLFASNPAGQRLQWLRATTSNSSGNFGFAVDGGCYALTFIAPEGSHFASGGGWLTHTACVEPGDERTDLDAVLVADGQGAATIGDMVVYADGTPAAGVAIDLFEADADGSRGSYLRSTTSDDEGGYHFEVAVAGCYAVTFIAPDGDTFTSGSPWYTGATCVADGESDDSVDAELASPLLDPASVAGTVTDGDVGASGVQVDLFEANGDGTRGRWLGSATTVDDGSYGFEVGGGCYVVTFVAPDGRTFTNGSQWLNSGTCVEAGETTTADAALV